GRNDNFFELGGHSLMALRLLAQVERTLGFKIDLAALFKAPTLQKFAACLSLRDRSSEPWQIVEIQPQGEKTPIIAINNAILYHNLAQKIASNRRFLSVQLFDPTNPQPLPPRSLNEIAADYVRLIRKAQPHGPYILLGLCVAGLIAYEAAQQLRQEGETVPLVIMTDTRVPGDRKPLSFARRSLDGWLFRLRSLKHHLRLFRRGQKRLVEILVTYRLVRMSRILDLASALHLVDSSMLEKEYWGNHWFLPSLEEAAQNRYRISSSFGDVVLFQSDTFNRNFTDRNMGWSDVVKGRLFFFHIPGWHHLIFLDERADLVAGYLRPLLDQADAEQDRPVVQSRADVVA
ncbi:MAG TPA: thioesterase domain-containing protein, partial [Methylocella sp.]|nr:thioesterase domain-containing protein [Methylocella sp.]